MKYLITLILSATLIGCTTPKKFYEGLPHGKLTGELNLQWRDHPTKPFVYIPNPDNPLTYVTSSGDVITPGAMYTDGGSIPRIVSLDKEFVPWKFGPAYIIHDWIFELHDCGWNEDGKYTHENAAQIMSEVMKTQFVQANRTPRIRERIAMWEIYGFVLKFSKGIWDSADAECEVPPAMTMKAEMVDEHEEMPENYMNESLPRTSEENTEEFEEMEEQREQDMEDAKSTSTDTPKTIKEGMSDAMPEVMDKAIDKSMDEDSTQPQPIPYRQYLEKNNLPMPL